MLDALAPSRLRARPSSAAKPFAMRTDLEVLQALHTLGYAPLVQTAVHGTCRCACTSSTSRVEGLPLALCHYDDRSTYKGLTPAGTSAPSSLPTLTQHSQRRCSQTHHPRPLPS